MAGGLEEGVELDIGDEVMGAGRAVSGRTHVRSPVRT